MATPLLGQLMNFEVLKQVKMRPFNFLEVYILMGAVDGDLWGSTYWQLMHHQSLSMTPIRHQQFSMASLSISIQGQRTIRNRE